MKSAPVSQKFVHRTPSMPRRMNSRRMDSETSSSTSASSSPYPSSSSCSSSSSHVLRPKPTTSGKIDVGPLLSSVPIDVHTTSELNGFRERNKKNNAYLAILNSALTVLSKSNTERRSLQRTINLKNQFPYPPQVQKKTANDLLSRTRCFDSARPDLTPHEQD